MSGKKKKRRPRGGADAKWNYPTLDRVRIWYRGYIYAEQKINKNKHKNKKTKRRSEFSGSFGKRRRREKKRKKEMKEENEGGK